MPLKGMAWTARPPARALMALRIRSRIAGSPAHSREICSGCRACASAKSGPPCAIWRQHSRGPEGTRRQDRRPNREGRAANADRYAKRRRSSSSLSPRRERPRRTRQADDTEDRLQANPHRGLLEGVLAVALHRASPFFAIIISGYSVALENRSSEAAFCWLQSDILLRPSAACGLNGLLPHGAC